MVRKMRWNIPNILTLFRILIIPILIYFLFIKLSFVVDFNNFRHSFLKAPYLLREDTPPSMVKHFLQPSF